MGRKNLRVKRRKEIVTAFYEVSKNIGLENVSIANLADYMQISKGLVLHYFESKDAILEELNSFILEEYIKFIDEDTPVEITTQKELEDFIQKMFSRKWSDFVDDGVFYSLYALIYRDPRVNQSFKSFNSGLRQVVKEKLQSAKDNRVIANDHIDTINEIIFAMLDGGYFYLGTQLNDQKAYEKQANIYINHVISLMEFN